MDRVLRIAKNKGDLVIKSRAKKYIIVDFYNVYCSLVKFDKFKTFSESTFKICINKILSYTKNTDVIIISKNIFEVSDELIFSITRLNRRLKYVIVEDKFHLKSFNRERDDYACILYNYKLKNTDSYIVTNDKFSNFENILTSVKPFNLRIIEAGVEKNIDFTKEIISKHNELFKNEKFIPARSEFSYLRKYSAKK